MALLQLPFLGRARVASNRMDLVFCRVHHGGHNFLGGRRSWLFQGVAHAFSRVWVALLLLSSVRGGGYNPFGRLYHR